MSGLLDILVSPLGIAASVGMLVFLSVAAVVPFVRWIGLGAAMYAASLQKFFDKFRDEEWYPHVGAIETVVQNGRLITLGLMVALLAVTLGSGLPKRQTLEPPRLMWPIHAIQVLLMVKMFLGGVSIAFVVQAGIVYALVAALGIFGVKVWHETERSLAGPAAALTAAIALFCGVVEYELRVAPQAVLLHNGRLIGTCGNPQHAAVLLAACLPGPLYLVTQKTRSLWQRILSGLLLVPAFHLLFLTGSRTGALMALIAMGLFFRRRAFLAIVVGSVLYAAFVLLLQPGEQGNAIRLTSLEDTRSHVWRAQWRAFLEHPVFGSPIHGERLGFGENSWLAVLQTTGVVGGALLVWLLTSIMKLGWSLLKLERRAGHSLSHVDFCLAGLAALFVGSFLEAYLLGVITLPILAILTYSVTTDRLVGGAQLRSPNRQWGRKRNLPRSHDLPRHRRFGSLDGE